MNAESLISTIIVSVIGLAIVAVLVSNKANTAKVIGASGSGLANVIGAAVSPVTGAKTPVTVTSNTTFGGSLN